MNPFALLITWTTYGTWLPGDARGHISNVRHADGSWEKARNTPGTAFMPGDARTREHARSPLKHDPVWLNREQAEVVAAELVAATKSRGWRIRRAAVMSNHVHVVIDECPDDGPAVRRILKGTTQAALSRYAGRPQCWWTEGGSDRYKHGFTTIENAIDYVAKQHKILAEIIDHANCRACPGR